MSQHSTPPEPADASDERVLSSTRLERRRERVRRWLLPRPPENESVD